MTDAQPRVRQNYLAVLVAAIASFVFEALWYSLFLDTWLNGIGRTREWLAHSGMSEGIQYAVALVSAAVIAMAISCVTQLTGAQTWRRGAATAAKLWAGFVLPVWATEYIFEVRPWSLFAVNAGFWLVGMMLMGAIVGAWKKK
ncbi:MAG: DUF1761 domain-containing protein [Terracidiphilus sp.]